MKPRSTTTLKSESKGESRQVARHRLVLPVRVQSLAAHDDAIALDISTGGCLIEMRHEFEVGDTVEIELPGDSKPRFDATIVWTGDGIFGCQFDTQLPSPIVDEARLRGTPLQSGSALDQGSAEQLAVAIGSARRRSGLSATELARRTGVSRPTLWSWETGKTRPSQANLVKLREALAISRPNATEGVPGNDLTQKLEKVIADHRRGIARETGMDEDRIKISIRF